jgi:hypothetical protein
MESISTAWRLKVGDSIQMIGFRRAKNHQIDQMMINLAVFKSLVELSQYLGGFVAALEGVRGGGGCIA